MARKLNIKVFYHLLMQVPTINQEITLKSEQLCTVYGIKQIDPAFIVK